MKRSTSRGEILELAIEVGRGRGRDDEAVWRLRECGDGARRALLESLRDANFSADARFAFAWDLALGFPSHETHDELKVYSGNVDDADLRTFLTEWTQTCCDEIHGEARDDDDDC